MAPKKGKISRKQEAAVAGLLLKPSIQQAAKYAEISQRTLLRWLKDDDFNKAYREARFHLVQQAISQIQDATHAAVKTLCEVLNNKEAPSGVRVRAASIIIDNALKATEIDNLEARISILEGLTLQKGGKK
jgi:hypothetical protein